MDGFVTRGAGAAAPAARGEDESQQQAHIEQHGPNGESDDDEYPADDVDAVVTTIRGHLCSP